MVYYHVLSKSRQVGYTPIVGHAHHPFPTEFTFFSWIIPQYSSYAGVKQIWVMIKLTFWTNSNWTLACEAPWSNRHSHGSSPWCCRYIVIYPKHIPILSQWHCIICITVTTISWSKMIQNPPDFFFGTRSLSMRSWVIPKFRWWYPIDSHYILTKLLA